MSPHICPCAEPVLTSLIVESEGYGKFFLSAISKLIVDLCVNPSSTLARRFHCSDVYLGQNLNHSDWASDISVL